MKAIVSIVALALLAVGCGSWGRTKAKFTGYSRHCVEGVSYLQFASGATVEYTPDGKIKTCH